MRLKKKRSMPSCLILPKKLESIPCPLSKSFSLCSARYFLTLQPACSTSPNSCEFRMLTADYDSTSHPLRVESFFHGINRGYGSCMNLECRSLLLQVKQQGV